MKLFARNKASFVIGVLFHECLTRGECLVGVISDGEVGFTKDFQGVRRVVLVEFSVAGTGTIDWNGYHGVGGDGLLNVDDVVGLCNEGRCGI